MIVVLGLVAAAALGIGMIVYTTSSPSHRTITINPAVRRAVKVDEAEATAAFDAQVAKYRAAGEPVRAGGFAAGAGRAGEKRRGLFC